MYRARAFFAAHGIIRIVRLVTDNGVNYRAGDFARAARVLASPHQRTRPYTARRNGEAERYQRSMIEELLHARPGNPRATAPPRAIGVWNVHYNYHRVHTAVGNQPQPGSYEPVSPTSWSTAPRQRCPYWALAAMHELRFTSSREAPASRGALARLRYTARGSVAGRCTTWTR